MGQIVGVKWCVGTLFDGVLEMSAGLANPPFQFLVLGPRSGWISPALCTPPLLLELFDGLQILPQLLEIRVVLGHRVLVPVNNFLGQVGALEPNLRLGELIPNSRICRLDRLPMPF